MIPVDFLPSRGVPPDGQSLSKLAANLMINGRPAPVKQFRNSHAVAKF